MRLFLSTEKKIIMQKLVSVVLISYNSSKYIIQTLDSIKNQTYQNIELIISDDCSTDDTVNIAKEWVKRNSSRFVRTVVSVCNRNSGIPKNLNNGIKHCNGYYIKTIAADDILDYMCIEKNYYECEKYGYRVLFSKMKRFYNQDLEHMEEIDYFKREEYFKYPPSKQNKVLSKENFLDAPTLFIENSLLIELDYFDEQYTFLEDYPMWFKMTAKGIKLNFLDEATIYYRIHSNSVSHSKNDNTILNKKFYSSDRLFFNKIRLKSLIKNGYFYKLYQNYTNYLYKDIVIILGNKKNFLTTSAKIILLLNPEILIYQIKKRLSSGLL